MRKFKYQRNKDGQQLEELLSEMDTEISIQKKIEADQKLERQKKVEQDEIIKRETMHKRIAITTTIPGNFTPEKQKLLEDIKVRNDSRPKLAPDEFKLFDNRIDFEVKKKDEFDGISQASATDNENFDNQNLSQSENASEQAIDPQEFKLADNRFDYDAEKLSDDGDDGFSVSEARKSFEGEKEVEGLFEYAKKFDGDQGINTWSENVDTEKDKNQATQVQEQYQTPKKAVTFEDQKNVEGSPDIKKLVDATIEAWNSCPSIVKKQLDQQHAALTMYKEKVSDLEYQLGLRNKEFEKRLNIDSVRNLEKKKKELERENTIILEREKKRVVEIRLREMQMLKTQNKELEMETRRLKLLLKKYKK